LSSNAAAYVSTLRIEIFTNLTVKFSGMSALRAKPPITCDGAQRHGYPRKGRRPEF
jgi:hypothetical protein